MKYRKLSELKKLDNNPRVIKKDQMEVLVTSIKNNPDYFEARPLILSNRTGELVILGGNQRYEAAKILGLEKVPTHLIENLTEEREQEIIIRDNVSNGEWDWDILANEWEQDKLEDWGLDTKQEWISPEVEEDEAPAVDDTVEPESKLGEVYQLGRHRLMCGDSTKIEDVEKLMDGKKADMVFTDPPYGMDLDTDYSKLPSTKKEGNKTYSKVIGDSEQFNFQDYSWIDCAEQIWFGANYYAKTLPDGGSWLVWDKRVEEKFDKMFGSGFEIAWSKTPHKQKIYRHNNTLFGGDSEARGKEHPTQKPTKLCAEIIKDIGKDGDVVLDLFGGSGSTLIACEQLDRTCYMLELDPKYCDVIRKRYHKFITGSDEGWQEATSGIR